jgi:putative NADPH-quinone reductase
MASICILQGHPDPTPGRFCHALADAYRRGAQGAGHTVTTVNIAALDVPLLRSAADFATPATGDIAAAQAEILGADHLVVIFPLWLGGMPALLKAFFEQIARGAFLIEPREGGWPLAHLKGKSARVIVTMGMPAPAYALFMGGHGVKSLEGGILGMAGVGPIHDTLIGGVDGDPKHLQEWLDKVEALGAKGA